MKNTISAGEAETGEIVLEGHHAVQKFIIQAKQGEAVRFVKYMVFADSIRYQDAQTSAKDEMEAVSSVPLDQLYKEQREYLDKFWESSALEIDGDDALCAAVRYNAYQLIQSVGKDPYCDIAAKGLSGEGYEGHYFWDTEMYMQPFFTLTNPEVSKNLVEYRYSTLSAL